MALETPTPLIEVRNRYTEEVMFSGETVRDVVELAIASGVSLRGANLSRANLEGANLEDTLF